MRLHGSMVRSEVQRSRVLPLLASHGAPAAFRNWSAHRRHFAGAWMSTPVGRAASWICLMVRFLSRWNLTTWGLLHMSYLRVEEICS